MDEIYIFIEDFMKKEKHGFVYIWFDRKHKRYYIGCHWGSEDDGYICSSTWMNKAYKIRPDDFKRRVIKTNITSRPDMYIEEQQYLDMIKQEEIKPKNIMPRYYNLNLSVGNIWHKYPENIKTIGAKISVSKTGKNTGPRDPSVGAKISAAKKGKQFTEEHRKALSEAKLNKTLSDEHIAALREGQLKSYRDGRVGAWTDKHFTQEHKNKISVRNKGKTLNLSEDEKQHLIKRTSKDYIIEYFSGVIINIHGLKAFATEQNIPYVTLYKSSQNQTSIKKYNIRSIHIS
jgi:hypothetical protein